MQGLYEYDLKPLAAYSGMISDTNFRPNIIYRTLSGGKTYQIVAVQVNTVEPDNTFTVTAGLILLNGSSFTATVTVTATATLNTPSLIARELARRLQSIPQFDQVAVADASDGNKLVVRAKRFGVNPISTFNFSSTPANRMSLAIPFTPAVEVQEVPFGFAVTETAADTPTECRLYTGGLSILGIALASATVEQGYPPSNLPISTSTPPDRYRAGDIVPILDFRQKGQRVWVWCGGNPVKGAEPLVNGSGQIVGSGGAGVLVLSGARFTGRVSGSIAEIEF